ncbi:hypothetical protein H310_10704 [Aphanomyces invadans]|uniref:Adhesin domain-containing protein n=1 Tax=Aphanomyces invadans TaxID=157072 RepID=A0A024TPV8_9STRA|nr:hypothetical protein H310_10704 [Aphanomyces invadans]ETV96058.1 hypothetical protein H310_10704 [Aphanomyces invadans]RHY29278.1 hypothetical protein DYB32_005275 [Aphanomyces invadans]|eukprot:XP_008875369.1 hypothetical protein H310_10704 [Aphanomyces invadans]
MPASPWFRREYDSLAVISRLVLEVGNVSVVATSDDIKTTSVVLHSESAAAAESFRVQEDGHELAVKWEEDHPVDPSSDYSIEIHMPRESIDAVAFSGAGTVSVHPNTLRRSVDANLTIASTGPGSLLVDDTDIRAGSLHLRQGGAGVLQLTCHDFVVAYEVDVQTTSTGSTVMHASSSVSASQVTLTGSAGYTTVQVNGPVKVTDFIDLRASKAGRVALVTQDSTTHHLAMTTTGNGAVTVNGTMHAHSVVVRGRGDGSVRVCGADGSCHALEMDVAGNSCASVEMAATLCSVAIDGRSHVSLCKGQVVTSKTILGDAQLKTLDECAPHDHATMELVPFAATKKTDDELER